MIQLGSRFLGWGRKGARTWDIWADNPQWTSGVRGVGKALGLELPGGLGSQESVMSLISSIDLGRERVDGSFQGSNKRTKATPSI